MEATTKRASAEANAPFKPRTVSPRLRLASFAFTERANRKTRLGAYIMSRTSMKFKSEEAPHGGERSLFGSLGELAMGGKHHRSAINSTSKSCDGHYDLVTLQAPPLPFHASRLDSFCTVPPLVAGGPARVQSQDSVLSGNWSSRLPLQDCGGKCGLRCFQHLGPCTS